MQPTLHPTKSIRFYKEPRNPNAPLDLYLVESMRTKGQYDPIHLFECDGELYCFKGFRKLRAAIAAGLELIKGIVYQIDEKEAAMMMAVDVFNTKGHTLYDKYRTMNIVREVHGTDRTGELAQIMDAHPEYISRMRVLDNIAKELLSQAESMKLGLDWVYTIGQFPPSEHKRLIEEAKSGRCKDLIKTIATPRSKTGKKVVKHEHYLLTMPDKSTLDLKTTKNFDPKVNAQWFRELGNIIERLSEYLADTKELFSAAILELRLKQRRGDQNAA